MIKKIAILCLFLAKSFFSQAQTETLTNQKITELSKAKLGNEVIVGLIHSSPGNFDCSVAGIIQLKKDSVSEAVINEIVNSCKTAKQGSAMVAMAGDKGKPRKDSVKYGPVDAAKVQRAMEAMRVQKDEFRKSVSFFSQKTPSFTDDVDRLYGYVFQAENGYVYFKLVVSHVNVFRSGYRNIAISQIAMKADTSTYLITSRGNIYGNGTNHVYYDAALHYDSEECAFVKKIITSKETKIRFEEAGGTYLDFKVSDREKKALGEVMELYKAMRGIIEP